MRETASVQGVADRPRHGHLLHIITSVGWLGAVAGFLVVALTGLTSTDPRLVSAAYIGMDLIGRTIIIPLSLASLWSGVIQGIGTTSGLFRNYWVLIKLVITALATALLLGAPAPGHRDGRDSLGVSFGSPDMTAMTQLVADAGAAMLALLVTTVLSVYRPRGYTRHGQRIVENNRSTFRAGKAALFH